VPPALAALALPVLKAMVRVKGSNVKIIFCLLMCFSTAAAATDLPEPLNDRDFAPVRPAEAALGRLLFYDPILSGNKEVACATCHHPAFGTSDGVSLAIGDGGIGLGPKRVADVNNPPEARIPRNAQSLFNLGFIGYRALFYDGRIEAAPDRPGGFRTPLDDEMVKGFASLVSVQAMFPVLSGDEMAGHYSESDVSQAVRLGQLTNKGGAWDLIARRVAEIPRYAEMFAAVYPAVTSPDDIAFTDISNAIAAFMEQEWRSDSAPFDQALRGEIQFEPMAQAGADLFYGAAGCAACHSGPLLSDFRFHAMAVPQFGPGKAARFETHARDEGRFRVTGIPADYYAFRTPSLRNVALTGPWGHDGAYSDLVVFVTAHADPVKALADFDRGQVILPVMGVDDWQVMNDPDEVAAIAAAVTTPVVNLSQNETAQIVAFLNSLTDPAIIKGRSGVPATVPSDLQVPRP